MNRIRRLRRSLACLPRRAGALAAFAAAPAARRPGPPSPPGWKLPSGWNDYLQLPPGWRKHPPLPLGHVAGPVYKVPAQIPAPHHHHGRHARLADHLDHGHGCAAGRRPGASRLLDAVRPIASARHHSTGKTETCPRGIGARERSRNLRVDTPVSRSVISPAADLCATCQHRPIAPASSHHTWGRT